MDDEDRDDEPRQTEDDEDRRYDEMVDRHLEGTCIPNCPECRRRRNA